MIEVYSLSSFREYGLLNDRGLPRLASARTYFAQGLGDLNLVKAIYNYWRYFDEYGVIEKSWFEGSDCQLRHSYKAVKCSKRGNDVYRWRIEKRLGWMDRVKNLEFFCERDLNDDRANSSMLFFTLTYDINRCSRHEAWEDIGIEYNRWISRVRSKYGRVSVFRVFQSTINGYPHIHGVMLCEDQSFKVFKHKDVDGKISYRVYDKGDLETSWHSFVDVVAVRSVRGALAYCRRYITRSNLDSQEENEGQSGAIYENGSISDLDSALMWLFRKRSFAISGSFRFAYSDLIRSKHNSKEVQIQLDGSRVQDPRVFYRWLGVFRPRDLGILEDPPDWIYIFDKNPLEMT